MADGRDTGQTRVKQRRRDRPATHLAEAVALVGVATALQVTLCAVDWVTTSGIFYVATVAALSMVCRGRVRTIAIATTVSLDITLHLFLPHHGAAAESWAAWASVGALILQAGCLTGLTRRLDHAALVSSRALRDMAEAAKREQKALRVASETAADLAARATGDRLAREFQDDVGELIRAATSASEGVRGAVARISGVAEQAAKETAAIAGASRETSASAQTVAASVEQLASTVERVTQEVREVSDASFRAMDDAGATNLTVQNLADATSRIGDIARTIKDIAEQTNLLALNASIEAARAGEAGRGFSVVAGEVKALARRTAKATEQIEAQIVGIQTEMQQTMQAIDGIANTVAHLGGITVSVAGSMEEQASVAKDIAEHAMTAARSTGIVVDHLHELTEGAARANDAAREGMRDAERLAQQCDGVEVAVRHFVATLLAA